MLTSSQLLEDIRTKKLDLILQTHGNGTVINNLLTTFSSKQGSSINMRASKCFTLCEKNVFQLIDTMTVAIVNII